MSDWQIGDLALCVDDGIIQCDGGRHLGGNAPKKGAVLRVDGIVTSYAEDGRLMPCGCVTVLLAGGFKATPKRLRKILPDKHEACEAEFLTLLKCGKVKA